MESCRLFNSGKLAVNCAAGKTSESEIITKSLKGSRSGKAQTKLNAAQNANIEL